MRTPIIVTLLLLVCTAAIGAEQQDTQPSPLDQARQLLAQNLELGEFLSGRTASPTAVAKVEKWMADGITAARAALRAEPKRPEAHYLLGALLSLAYRPVESAGEGDDRVALTRGAKTRSEMMEGVSELRQAGRLQPQNVAYALDYPKALLIAGQAKLALAELDSVAKRFPKLGPSERATLAQLRAQVASSVNPPPASSPQPRTITWRSYDDGLALARKEGKRVLIDFMALWCGWCKKMDQDVYAQPSVVALGSRYVFVKVDADQRRDLTQKYRVAGLPTAVVLDSAGREINRISGYVDAQRFLVEVER